MTKADLIESIYEKVGLSKKESGEISLGSEFAQAVKWAYGGDYIVVGRDAGDGTEFDVFAFLESTETFTKRRGLASSSDIISTNWSHSNKYICRGDMLPHTGVYYGLAFNVDPLLNLTDVVLCFESDLVINVATSFNGTTIFNGRNHIRGLFLVINPVFLTNIGERGRRCISQDGLNNLILKNAPMQLQAILQAISLHL